MNFSAPQVDRPAAAAQPLKMRGRLFRKYVALFVAVVCVALIGNGLFEIWFSYQEKKGLLVRVQREQAEAAVGKISQFFKEIEGQVGWTTQLPWSAITPDEWRFDAARLLRQVPAITELARLDGSGREQLRVSRLAPDVIGSGIDFSADPRFVEALANKVYYGEVYFRRESEPYMTVAVAGSRRDAGVTVVEVNLKFIWDVVTQTKVGARGQAYVVDAQSRLIAHSDISLVLRNMEFGHLAQVRAARATGAVVPPEREVVAKDVLGREVLTAHAPVEPLGWLLFVELPLEEAYAPLYSSIARSGVLLLAALALAFLAGLFLARKMIVPIQALRAGAARIGSGDLGQRISIKTGDELEALGNQFNSMAAQLQESHANLEQKVSVRTSELTAANRRLAAQWERLRRANSFKSEILGKVAHDLKNPMNVILGRTEMLMELMAADEPQRDTIEAQVAHIRDSAQRLTAMIESLLADAMADALNISIRRGAVDIPVLVNEVVESVRPLTARKGQRIAVAAPGPLMVIGDFDRLREAVDNLVSNAIKYTPPGGHIELTVARAGGDAVIRVRDSGAGLTADDMSRLFGRFQRLSAKPTAGESSTGLGLSIVKRIVELHGGRVTAESPGPGRGSTFTIALPLHPDTPR